MGDFNNRRAVSFALTYQAQVISRHLIGGHFGRTYQFILFSIRK